MGNYKKKKSKNMRVKFTRDHLFKVYMYKTINYMNTS